MNGGTSGQRKLTINIRPEVTILSVLRHLNYRPWFALAEFVDNAIQSYHLKADAIHLLDGSEARLRVSIDIDLEGPGKISIQDNAGGIALEDFARAFRPAELPLDRTGLSEFGMGMKSAACWFADSWTVRTSALNESVERTVRFNIQDIVAEKLDELIVEERPCPPVVHFTEVVLEGLLHPPRGRAVSRIKEHLASIYRVFLQDGSLELRYKGEPLEFSQPKILRASSYREPDQPAVEWKKKIEMDFGAGQKVSGFAALREVASTPFAGFALFRRGRLIEGSADETYRPNKIFGNSNSYRFQRLFGELHLDGFEVSHTKDGFRWEELEDEFLDLLKEELSSQPLNLLDQAEGFRTRATRKSVAQKAKTATELVAQDLEHQVPSAIDEQDPTDDGGQLPEVIESSAFETSSRTVEVEFAKHQWSITIRTGVDPAQGDWLRIAERYTRASEGGTRVRFMTLDVSLAHPFSTEFLGSNNENVELLIRMATAFSLSIVLAEDSTAASPSFALHYLNSVLREALTGIQHGRD